MPYLLSNLRYLVIALLPLLFWGCRMSTVRDVKEKISEEIKSQPEPQPAEELQLNQPPLIYINSLPAFKLALEQQRQSILDTGTKMEYAYLDYIESLTSILVTLANYYSPKQFGNQTPQAFISEIIESRFRWHSAVVEPLGPMTGGKFALLESAAAVAGDVEEMIADMVFHLYRDDIIWGDSQNDEWHDEWVKAWCNSN